MNESPEISSVLACDVGNTAVHFAHVKGGDVQPPCHMRIGELAALGNALREAWEHIPAPRKLVAASVNPAGLRALEAAAQDAIHEPVLVIGRDLPLPMEADLPHPDKVGSDRLCAAVAAFDQLGVACVVADFGTAVTIDCVNDKGVFLGGAILPGLSAQLASLHEKTALLPEAELAEPTWVYGKDTRQAMIGGVVFGARGALRHLVEAYATELGHWPLVIVTGRDAALVVGDVADSEIVQAIVPDLVIRGVAIAYYKTLLK